MASTRVSSRDMELLSHHSSTTPTRCFMSENAALYATPKHLPEPPESDPEVMLRSMPERGKLLQAVMQAGPHLHTLLLAGPLPRWRRPPTTPVDPMESNLMMQCCNKVGSSSINYNYSMPNSRFPIFPMSSLSAIGEGGASSSAEGSKSHPVKMSAAASTTATTTWSMHMPRTSDSSTLAT